jgi:hypothetical protein
MTPAFTFGSLSCVVLACGGGCFESKCTPQPVPVVVPAEKPAEAPVAAQAPDATVRPEVAQAPDAAR